MQKITFYPIGSADCCLVETETKKFLFDYAHTKESENDSDYRIDLENAIRNKWIDGKRKDFDVVVFTHADEDHYNRFSELFYLEHAEKYQSDDRIKIKELWVPAAVICDDTLKNEGKILRAEARHRLRNKKGIRVFSSPNILKKWFEGEGLNIEDYRDCLVNAGKLVPGYNFVPDGVEFFAHSPFALRQDDGTLVDRNECSIVVQVCFKNDNTITKLIMSADTTCEAWEEIVNITNFHNNGARLRYDIFKLPHHCSYLSLSNDKGKEVTVPLPKVDWLFKQAETSAVIVSSSIPIPDEDTDQPPHRQAANYYKNLMKDNGGEFKVTMEHPKKSRPEPLEITIDDTGATIVKIATGAGTSLGSTQARRVG